MSCFDLLVWHISGAGFLIILLRLIWIFVGIITIYPHHVGTHVQIIKFAINPIGKKMVYTHEGFPPDPVPIMNIIRFPIVFVLYCTFAILHLLCNYLGAIISLGRLNKYWDSYWRVAELKSRLQIVPLDWQPPKDPNQDKIKAVASSGCWSKDYRLNAIYKANESYWCSTYNCKDVWITFHCPNDQLSKISITYQPEYKAKKILVYTNHRRGVPWSKFRKMCEKTGNGNMTIDINEGHEAFISLRFFNWTNGYVGIKHIKFELSDRQYTRKVVTNKKPPMMTVACSGSYNGYALEAMNYDNDNYWYSSDNCNDIWITFQCSSSSKKQLSQILIRYHSSYKAKKLWVYTSAVKGASWPKWKKLCETSTDKNTMIVDITGPISKFVCLRFFDWTGGYVGVKRVKFQFRKKKDVTIACEAPPTMVEEEELPNYDNVSCMGEGVPGTESNAMKSHNENEVERWLISIGNIFYSDYKHLFMDNGFDTMDAVKTLTENDLESVIGITKVYDRRTLLLEIGKL
eukprot:68111_1